MNKRIFVTADNHWQHENIIKFMRKDGVTPIRPWATLDEMHTAFIELWNSTVNEEDLVYCLGDWCLGNRKEGVPKWTRALKGRKILIMGNHDTAPASVYLEGGFGDVKACQIFEKTGVILTHIPVHERQFDRWKLNVHGHLHHDTVQKWVGQSWAGTEGGTADGWARDERYVCVSVEHTEFKPILLDDVLKKAGIK